MKALNRVDSDDQDWVSLSALGNHLNRTDPSFDARTYGFVKLGDLVKAQPFAETKTVTTPGGGENLWVRLRRRRPVEADAPEKPETPETPARQSAAKKTAKKAAKKSPKKTAPKAAAKAQSTRDAT